MKQLVLALDTATPPPAVVSGCDVESAPQHLAPRCADDPTTTSSTQIESEQLKRLANAVLAKDYRDLTALAACNPLLIEEWQQAFRRQHLEAEQDARYWASAAAILATANGLAERRIATK